MQSRALRHADVFEDDARLLAAFRRELTVGSRLHEELRSRFAQRRGEWGEPAPDFDYGEAEQGLMVRFSDLFPESQAAVLPHAGGYYLIDDDWCAQPGCRCGAGLIHLYRIVDEGGATPDFEKAGATEYAGSMHYPPSIKEPLPPKLTQAARGLVDALAEPDLDGLLTGRREAVRKAALAHFRALPPRAQPTKVGRNDLCPCGSGKKYKKCCQRATA